MTTDEILIKLAELYLQELQLNKELEKIKYDVNNLHEQLKNIYK